MITALLLVTLNVILVVSGVADGVYEKLAVGKQRVEGPPAAVRRYADNGGVAVPGECAYRYRNQQRLSASSPQLALAGPGTGKIC